MLLVALQFLLMPILNGSDDLAFYSRVVSHEFFDELRILANFIEGKGLTFDGIHASSGFYPLWFSYLFALVKVFGAGGKAFFVAFKLGSVIMLMLALWLFMKTCKRWQISPNVTYVSALYFTFAFLYQSASGQSTQLAIIWLLLIISYLPKFLSDHSFKKSFVLGLLLAMAGLTRTDSLLIIISFVIMFCIVDDKYEAKNIDALFKYRNILGLLLGVSPLIAFFIYNYYKFGETLPAIDAYLLQKQNFSANTDLWKQIFLTSIKDNLANPFRFFSITFAMWFSLFSFVVLLLKPKDAEFDVQKSMFVLLVFNVVIYYTAFSFLTHWQPFAVHFYVLVLVAPFCVAKSMQYMLDKLDTDKERLAMRVVVNFFGILFAFVIITLLKAPLRSTMSYDVYSLIKPFAKEHNGIYAMGSGSGLTSFIIDRQVVPLEGKTTNAEFLKASRDADELQDLLSVYGVKYFIGIDLPEKNSCYYAEEPALKFAGQGSSKLYTWFCSAPIFKAEYGEHKIYVFDIPLLKDE